MAADTDKIENVNKGQQNISRILYNCSRFPVLLSYLVNLFLRAVLGWFRH